MDTSSPGNLTLLSGRTQTRSGMMESPCQEHPHRVEFISTRRAGSFKKVPGFQVLKSLTQLGKPDQVDRRGKHPQERPDSLNTSSSCRNQTEVFREMFTQGRVLQHKSFV